MKLKKYGKNQRGLKKILASPETKVFKNGCDWTEIFKNLIGYDFMFSISKNGLDITDCSGETFNLVTNEKFEIA